MEEDNSSRTSVIVSKKSYFENSKLEEETNNLIQDETLSKNLENISEISKDLIGVNKNANEESQKDVVTDTEGTNDAAKDEDTLSEEMVDLNRISKVGNIHFISLFLFILKFLKKQDFLAPDNML